MGWITLHSHGEGDADDEGTVHVFIESGHVTKGPASLIGANIKHLAAHSARVERHPAGHEPAGARSHPDFAEHRPPEKPEPLPGKPYAREHGAPQTRQEQPAKGPRPLSAEEARAGLEEARGAARRAASGGLTHVHADVVPADDGANALAPESTSATQARAEEDAHAAARGGPEIAPAAAPAVPTGAAQAEGAEGAPAPGGAPVSLDRLVRTARALSTTDEVRSARLFHRERGTHGALKPLEGMTSADHDTLAQHLDQLRQEEGEASEKLLTAIGPHLQPLTGSPKQIAWAEELRTGGLASMASHTAMLDRMAAGHAALSPDEWHHVSAEVPRFHDVTQEQHTAATVDAAQRAHATLQRLATQTSAKDWIDQRSLSPESQMSVDAQVGRAVAKADQRAADATSVLAPLGASPPLQTGSPRQQVWAERDIRPQHLNAMAAHVAQLQASGHPDAALGQKVLQKMHHEYLDAPFWIDRRQRSPQAWLDAARAANAKAAPAAPAATSPPAAPSVSQAHAEEERGAAARGFTGELPGQTAMAGLPASTATLPAAQQGFVGMPEPLAPASAPRKELPGQVGMFKTAMGGTAPVPTTAAVAPEPAAAAPTPLTYTPSAEEQQHLAEIASRLPRIAEMKRIAGNIPNYGKSNRMQSLQDRGEASFLQRQVDEHQQALAQHQYEHLHSAVRPFVDAHVDEDGQIDAQTSGHADPAEVARILQTHAFLPEDRQGAHMEALARAAGHTDSMSSDAPKYHPLSYAQALSTIWQHEEPEETGPKTHTAPPGIAVEDAAHAPAGMTPIGDAPVVHDAHTGTHRGIRQLRVHRGETHLDLVEEGEGSNAYRIRHDVLGPEGTTTRPDVYGRRLTLRHAKKHAEHLLSSALGTHQGHLVLPRSALAGLPRESVRLLVRLEESLYTRLRRRFAR